MWIDINHLHISYLYTVDLGVEASFKTMNVRVAATTLAAAVAATTSSCHHSATEIYTQAKGRKITSHKFL